MHKLGKGSAQTASSFCGLEQDWGTTGAQESPFVLVVVLDETVLQGLYSSSVFHIVGPLANQPVGFRSR
jgi:hypothetical protein